MPQRKKEPDPAMMHVQAMLGSHPSHSRPAERVDSAKALRKHPSGRAKPLVRITPEMRVVADQLREPGETLSGFFARLMKAEARRKYQLNAATVRALDAAGKAAAQRAKR